ncbi:MAG: OmpA family protein [Paludibacteraceae bacterium]|nr:OmpA family protein [Paludibacteraceae bacterium]
MENKIKVHGKGKSRTVLGIVNAYLKINPETTESQLNEAFPANLHAPNDCAIFVDVNKVQNSDDPAFKKRFFEREDEQVVLNDGTHLAMMESWSEEDYQKVIKIAKNYGIEAETEPVEAFQRGSYTLEFLNGFDPDKKSKKCKCKWWWWLLLILLLLLIFLLLFYKCGKCDKSKCSQAVESTETVVEDTQNAIDETVQNAAQDAEEALDAVEEEVSELQEDAEALKAAAEAELEAKKEAFAKIVGDSQVAFEKASSNVASTSNEALEKMANYLKENKDAVLTITGHASPDGSKEYNQILSEKRAESVANQLKKLGVAAEQLKTIGAGATDGGDESNRNVTFSL